MMSKILVSIKDSREASIIKDLSIDIIDLKEISDLIVLKSLKNISYGRIKFINYDGNVTSVSYTHLTLPTNSSG